MTDSVLPLYWCTWAEEFSCLPSGHLWHFNFCAWHFGSTRRFQGHPPASAATCLLPTHVCRLHAVHCSGHGLGGPAWPLLCKVVAKADNGGTLFEHRGHLHLHRVHQATGAGGGRDGSRQHPSPGLFTISDHQPFGRLKRLVLWNE